MTGRDGFRVAVKPSAIEASEAAQLVVTERGDTLHFDSRAAAEAEARRLSERGATPLAIQRAAPQEPADVDAYLVARPERRTHDPVEHADGRLTFETTATQYGALGETLVCSQRANPPLLTAYARRHLADERPDAVVERLGVSLDPAPEPVVYTRTAGVDEPGRPTRLAWIPDCVARVEDGADGEVLAEYLCEVKTGDASFQRNQAAVMAYEARRTTVLTIRLDLSDLPDAYTARIDEVDPEAPPAGVLRGAAPHARLDDFR